ncbi:hypothetical protein F2P81_023803 [Scophthalmus maximus]|uniref:Uncharacterized protein n=1 Tax=Scophthalmus maximus TaxID=52904 RepID=A0A6A4RMT8_SCOMX|nr:hypothetical protein F2P81_023803 [Scophthalmus maximus]
MKAQTKVRTSPRRNLDVPPKESDLQPRLDRSAGCILMAVKQNPCLQVMNECHVSYLLTTSSKPRAPKWRGIHQLPTLRDDVISERQLPGGLLLTADMDQNHGDGKVACNTAEEEKNNTASTTRGCEKSCACLKSLFSVDVHL